MVGRLKKLYEEYQNFTGPEILDDMSTPKGSDRSTGVRKFMERVKGS